MEKMKENGTFYDLHARLLANLAEEIQNTDLHGLKPYKTLKTDLKYQIANDIVLRYLSGKKMNNTLKAIMAESGEKVKLHPDPKWAASKLNYQSGDAFHELNLFINECADRVFYENREILKEGLKSRLQELSTKRK